MVALVFQAETHSSSEDNSTIGLVPRLKHHRFTSRSSKNPLGATMSSLSFSEDAQVKDPIIIADTKCIIADL